MIAAEPPTGISMRAATAPTPAETNRTTFWRTPSPITTLTMIETADMMTVSPNPGDANVASAKEPSTSPSGIPALHASFKPAYGTVANTETAASQTKHDLRPETVGGCGTRRPHRGQLPRSRRTRATIHAVTATSAASTARCISVADQDGATSNDPPAPVIRFAAHTTTMRMVCGRASSDPTAMTAAHAPVATIPVIRTRARDVTRTRTAAAAATTAVSHAGVVGIATGSAGPRLGRSADARNATRQQPAASAVPVRVTSTPDTAADGTRGRPRRFLSRS